MYLVLVFILIFGNKGVSCEGCNTDGDIRLVNGSSPSEGRVEVYWDGQWSTVCDNMWDNNDAMVVCRQLGFSANGAQSFRGTHFGEGSQPILLDNIACTGQEDRLVDCHGFYLSLRNCIPSQAAGVRCQSNERLEDINLRFTGASVLMTWTWQASLTHTPGKYSVIVQSHGPSNINAHAISIEVPGTVTEVRFPLLPDQNYSYCLTAFYTHAQQTRRASACDRITLPLEQPNIPTTSQPEQPTRTETLNTSSCPSPPLLTEMEVRGMSVTETECVCSCQTGLVGGVLGLVIVLLILLLLLALVYPRCRARMKDKKYLSNVSQAIHVDHNPAYIEHPQAVSGSSTTDYGDHESPTYEVASDSGPSHVTVPGSHMTSQHEVQ